MVGRSLALATLVALAGLGVQGVQLHATQTHTALAELGAGVSAASRVEGELNPEERKLAHERAFLKDFTVELDMVAAREKGLHMGVDLDTDTDFTPVSVSKIRKSGLLELWNRAHPDDAVLLGDTITKVNDILWHHNSKTFVERIKGQFKASKKGLEGTSDLLKLFIQRPRRKNEGRTQAQRDGLYRTNYPKDFTVDIPFVSNESMGWVLNSTADDWVPPVIESISSTGMVALWNQEHPDAVLYPGDEIIMSNGIQWHHNTKVFKNRIETMMRRTIAEANSTVAMSLHIQRPKSVAEVLDSRSFEETFEANVSDFRGSTDIGWVLQMNTSDPINITDIPSGGFLSTWNERNPTQSLAVGDRILKADSVDWQSDKGNFGNSLLNLMFTGHGATLRVQRKTEFKYAKGWTVEIPARVGWLLGLRMDASHDEFPVTIQAIKPLSAVSIFNEDNPDDELKPGDHIFMVNDFLWRNNSREFVQHLEKQFSKCKKTGVMRLWVQRPVGVETESESSGSSHRYMDYTVELNVSSPQAMGWKLNTTSEGQVVVSELSVVKASGTTTSISSWNEKNPLKEIAVGDYVMQVDNNPWHNNTDIFMKHLSHQLADAASSTGKGSVLVLMRRPFATSPVVEGDVSMPPQGASQVEDDGDVMGAGED